MKVLVVKFFLFLMFIVTSSAHGQLVQSSQSVRSQSPQFSAKQILPPSVYQTSSYKVNDGVSVVDHNFHFNIETTYGVFPVSSIVMLEKRLSELRAIDEAARLGDQAIAVRGAWQTVKQTPRGAGHLLSDPLGALREVPQGFKKAAANFVDPVSRHAGSATRRQLAANQLGGGFRDKEPGLERNA